jgi:hypothetical protein
MNDSDRSKAANELNALALQKMAAVLGHERARQLLRHILDELGIELQTPQDLYRFAETLRRYAGFEGAVGAMLSVAAVMRGAGPRQ